MVAWDAVTIRIMPTSPSADLNKIKETANSTITKLGGNPHSSEEQEIAFGLKSLTLIVAWPESQKPDVIESELAKIKDVNSVEITDVRRAIG